MSLAIPDAGSFRDPNGRIYQRSGEIFRSVMGRAADEFASFRESGLFDDWALVRQGRLSTMEAPEKFVVWMRSKYPKAKI